MPEEWQTFYKFIELKQSSYSFFKVKSSKMMVIANKSFPFIPKLAGMKFRYNWDIHWF